MYTIKVTARRFENVSGVVYVEKSAAPSLQRAFRFDAHGNAEMTRVEDLRRNGSRARWYGFALKRDQFDIRRKQEGNAT